VKVLVTRDARNDLQAIALYIARDNPPRAMTFVAELEAVAHRIAETPRGFPLVPRYEQQGVRRRSWRGYGILYAARSDAVVVLRILGPGQDHDRILGLK
jgi:toxin ParE1/3/4